MKRLFLLALSAALVAAPAETSAQIYSGIPDAQEYLNFVSGSSVGASYGVQVGPYVGHFQGDPTTARFSIYCVDYNHYAKSTSVNVTQLASSADLSNTRLNADPSAYQRYLRAAYLSSLFETLPTSQWGELHAAIWTVTSGVTPGGSTGSFLTSAYATPGGFTGAGWYILTPENMGSSGSGQEFLMRTTSVPEPSTLLLLGTGLALLAVARRRRFDLLGDDA